MPADCDRCPGKGRTERGKGADPEKKIRGPLVKGLKEDGISSWCYSCLLDYFKALIAGKTGKVLFPNPYYGKKLHNGASHALFELEFLTIWVPLTPQAQPRWNGKAAGHLSPILAIGPSAIGKWNLTPDELVHKAGLVEAKLGDVRASSTVVNEVKRSKIPQCPVCGLVNASYLELNLKSPCACWGCIAETWTSYYDARLGGVKNPHYDATSSSPYLCAPFISVCILAKRMPNNLHPLLIIKGAGDMHPDEFVKAAAAFDDARSARNEKTTSTFRARREKEYAELQALAVKAGVHQLTATEKDTAHKLGVKIASLVDQSADLLSVNKVSLKPVGKGDFQIVRNEDTRKMWSSGHALIVDKLGRALNRNKDFEAHVFGPDADPGKEIEKLRAKGKKGGPPIQLATFIVTVPTTPDDACCSEEELQGHCNAIDLPNHTEDTTYHRGSTSGKHYHAACCVVVWIGALSTVADGKFFWSSSMPPFMMGRLWAGYEEFRPPATWHCAQIEDTPEDASQSTMDKFLAGSDSKSKAGAPKPKPNVKSSKPKQKSSASGKTTGKSSGKEVQNLPDVKRVRSFNLRGASVAFSGTFDGKKNKDGLGELAVLHGATKSTGKVSKSTTLLVLAKRKETLSGAEQMAAKYGVPVMTFDDFIALIDAKTSVPVPKKSSSAAPGKATSPGNAKTSVPAPQKSSSAAPGKATSPGNATSSVPVPQKSSSAAPGKATSPGNATSAGPAPGSATKFDPAPKKSSNAAPGKVSPNATKPSALQRVLSSSLKPGIVKRALSDSSNVPKSEHKAKKKKSPTPSFVQSSDASKFSVAPTNAGAKSPSNAAFKSSCNAASSIMVNDSKLGAVPKSKNRAIKPEWNFLGDAFAKKKAKAAKKGKK